MVLTPLTEKMTLGAIISYSSLVLQSAYVVLAFYWHIGQILGK